VVYGRKLLQGGMIIYVRNLLNLVCVFPKMNKYKTILTHIFSVNIKAVNTIKVSFQRNSSILYSGKGCTRAEYIV